MNEHLPPEVQRYLRDLERENPGKLDQIRLQARLGAGINHPEILTPDERALLERMRQDEPDKFEELQMFQELIMNEDVSRVSPTAPHCSRLVPFAHALTGFLIAGVLLWWLGAERPWVYVAALPGLYGLWNLKSALFASQATLDSELYGDR